MNRKERAFLIHIIVLTIIYLFVGIFLVKSWEFIFIWILTIFYMVMTWIPFLNDYRVKKRMEQRKKLPETNYSNIRRTLRRISLENKHIKT